MNWLKRIIILIALPLLGGAGGGLFAQSVQSGIVLEYQSEKAKVPMAGVTITAANASSTMSGDDGCFTLNFRTLKPGDAIQFRRIEKAGYEVMNREAVEMARIARETSKPRNFEASIKIVLCQTSLLNEIRDGYRSVTVKRYEKQLTEQEKEIQRLKDEGRIQEEEYNARLDSLEAAHEEQLANIETYIDRFARIDMTALGEAEARTIRLVQDGRFEEAIANYESQDLVTLLNQTQAERQQLAKAAEQIEALIASKQDENTRLRQSISRQIDLLHLAGGQDNMEKIHRILCDVFLADTTDVTARREYANSLYGRGELSEACALLENGLSAIADKEDIAMVALDIASYLAQSNEERMMHFTHLADSVIQTADEHSAKVNSRILPSVCYLLMITHFNHGNWDECGRIAARMEGKWSPDSLDLSSILDYTTLLHVMSAYYSQTGNHERSVWAAEESVRLDEISYKTTPWRTTLFLSCASACDVMAMEGRWPQAKAYAHRSLEVAEATVKKNSTQEMMKVVCDNAFTIHWTLVDMGETALADSVAQFVEPLYARLHERQREPLNGSRGLFLLSRGDIEAATPLLNEDMGDEAAAITIAPFRAKKALSQPSPKREEAIEIMLSAVKAAKQQYDEEPDAWNKDTYCCHCITLAEIYASLGDKKNAKRWLRQAKKLVVFESNRIKIKRNPTPNPSP